MEAAALQWCINIKVRQFLAFSAEVRVADKNNYIHDET